MGPPGTGKTTVLARIVEGHYRAGRSVLLVSNTNIAVDTALEKVAERLDNIEDESFQNGAVLRLGQIVKKDFRFGGKALGNDDWIDGLHEIIPPNIELADDQWGAFNEAGFYPAFARDLETARESIVIVSPFLTNRGVARWMNHVRAALERGVQVRIVTRPGAEFGGASEDEVKETIDSLRVLGIAVDLRGRMHEKLAVIDQRVAWHGSLNVLSHRDTSESMLRLTGEQACGRLMDLITPPYRRRDKQRAPSESENPPCLECGTLTVLQDGRFGLYLECPRCGEKADPGRGATRKDPARPRQEDEEAAEATAADNNCACRRTGCNGRMIRKSGRYGPFLGCSNYPRCSETSRV